MKSAYAIVSYRPSPVMITSPKLVAVYEDRKAAKAEVKRKNKAALSNRYWVERVPFHSNEKI